MPPLHNLLGLRVADHRTWWSIVRIPSQLLQMIVPEQVSVLQMTTTGAHERPFSTRARCQIVCQNHLGSGQLWRGRLPAQLEEPGWRCLYQERAQLWSSQPQQHLAGIHWQPSDRIIGQLGILQWSEKLWHHLRVSAHNIQRQVSSTPSDHTGTTVAGL